MKIAVVGIGYVGLSISTILSQNHDVVAVDIVQKKVEQINQSISPIVDKDVSAFFMNKKLSLVATMNVDEAFKNADFVVISTPTNYNSSTKKFDASSVDSVIKQVKNINNKAWIVIKSTVDVGFTKKAVKKHGFKNILFSPEFLREGKALYDNLYPSRIVVGVPEKNEEYLAKANEFASLLKEGAIKKDIETFILGSTEAEAVKLFSNTFLALRIAYFNELDTFALSKGLDSADIIRGVSSDPRIGDFYNNPSFGYGGYCLPKDTKELKENFEDIPENLISAIVESNETRVQFICQDIIKRVKSQSAINKPYIVGIYRLIMKSGSDNFRQSSVQSVMNILKSNGIEIVIFEPTIKEDSYLDFKVIHDFQTFAKTSSLVIANRYDGVLDCIKEKIYTRDLFRRD